MIIKKCVLISKPDKRWFKHSKHIAAISISDVGKSVLFASTFIILGNFVDLENGRVYEIVNCTKEFCIRDVWSVEKKVGGGKGERKSQLTMRKAKANIAVN